MSKIHISDARVGETGAMKYYQSRMKSLESSFPVAYPYKAELETDLLGEYPVTYISFRRFGTFLKRWILVVKGENSSITVGNEVKIIDLSQERDWRKVKKEILIEMSEFIDQQKKA